MYLLIYTSQNDVSKAEEMEKREESSQMIMMMLVHRYA